ncbi:MAG: transcription termination/antitermination protein NusG [Oscillospiraceae bacterium]|jgi:transcriptional antiterminator NusG|nr:transcription termination/antitermination protein NusG [Oscillospiraceae bacterium]
MGEGEAMWYVVHTYSGYEKNAADTIRKVAENRGMTDLIIDINIPVETVTELVEGQRKTTERRIYPGYLLVKMVMTDDSWHLVRNVRGVTGFVGSANKAIPLTDEEIRAMNLEKQQDEPEKREVVIGYKIGSTVRVISGPLIRFIGTVEDIDVERSRARVIVSMFGRETPVDLDFDQIEAE